MLYEEARVYLDQASKYGSVLGLESISNLLEELNRPQDALTFVHIAGTNGKGSILAYASAILQAEGYKIGRYISPTVMEYLERFQINGSFMETHVFGELMEEIREAVGRMKAKGKKAPTVFEIETAVAFLFFAKEKCDYVLLETGLGGRLDATNVVDNVKVCAFASISRDHMQVLGGTLEDITREKAGIIKAGARVVSAPQAEPVTRILREASAGTLEMVDASHLIVKKRSLDEQVFSYKEFSEMSIHLLGNHQIENAATALEIIRTLREQGVSVSEASVRTGLGEAKWSGRFQIVRKSPLLIVDGAHNEDAARRLAENMRYYFPNTKAIGIMGVFKDKEYQKIIQLMKPYLEFVYTIELPDRERTLPKETLKSEIEKQGLKAETAEDLEMAMKKAQEKVSAHQPILAFGSLSYLGQVICQERR